MASSHSCGRPSPSPQGPLLLSSWHSLIEFSFPKSNNEIVESLLDCALNTSAKSIAGFKARIKMLGIMKETQKALRICNVKINHNTCTSSELCSACLPCSVEPEEERQWNGQRTKNTFYARKDYQHNPIHVYSEVSPAAFNEIYRASNFLGEDPYLTR